MFTASHGLRAYGSCDERCLLLNDVLRHPCRQNRRRRVRLRRCRRRYIRRPRIHCRRNHRRRMLVGSAAMCRRHELPRERFSPGDPQFGEPWIVVGPELMNGEVAGRASCVFADWR